MKFLTAFAKIITFGVVVNLCCYSVYHVMNGGERFGPFSEKVVQFATLPLKFTAAVRQLVLNFDPYRIEKEEDFQPVNEIKDDIYILVSHFENSNDRIVFNLKNLKNDEILHQWFYPVKDAREIGHATSTHPVLLDDYSIVFGLHIADLVKLDSESNVVWKNTDVAFHHSKELDSDGSLWVPTAHKDAWSSNLGMQNAGGGILHFRDDKISNVDLKTGEVLFSKSVTEILLENGYEDLVYRYYEQDLVHLNDIQPVMSSTRYWNKGDLFISCRNIHTVFQYRPSTNEIVWLKTGPWINQHDVDIIDSNTIMVFNNNYVINNRPVYRKKVDKVEIVESDDRYNQVIMYDFSKDETQSVFSGALAGEKICTRLQGRSQLLSNGNLFIEETNEGKFFIAGPDGIVYRQHFSPVSEEYAMMPGWSRVYEEIPPNKY